MYNQSQFGGGQFNSGLDAGSGGRGAAPERGSVVHPIVFAIPVICAAPAVINAASAQSSLEAAPLIQSLVSWSVVVVLAVGLAKLAAAIGGRSRAVGSVAFSIVCILWGANSWMNVESVKAAAAFSEQMQSETDRSLARAQEEFDTQGYVSYDEQETERMSRALEDVGRKMRGDEAAAARATAVFVREFGDLMKREQDSTDRFIEAGGVQAGTLMTLGSIAERERLLDEAVANCERTDSYLHSAPRHYRGLLRGEGVSAGAVEVVTSEFMRGLDPRRLLAAREPDRAVAESFRAMLAMLKGHHGHWSVEADGLVLFDATVPDSVLEEFNMLADRAIAAAERGAELQAELLERRRRVVAEERRRQSR